MKPGEVVEFFLAGTGTMPGLLVWLGEPGLAVVVLVGLLLAACLGGMADPEAPFRTLEPPPGGGEAPQSGMRQTAPQARQRTRSQG